MATLEKIRSKSVFLFIIIIVALLAFILGDFLNSKYAWFGHGDTIAKADGIKISQKEYADKVSELTANQQQNIDGDIASQYAIQMLAQEKLLNEEYDRLGITVTDEEISKVMTSNALASIRPDFFQQIQQLGMQIGKENATGADIIDIINNPARYNLPQDAANQIKTEWAKWENEVEKAIKENIYNYMLLGLFNSNKVDAQQAHDAHYTTHSIEYAMVDYATVKDDDVKVSDDDIKKKYEEQKEKYRIDEESRLVNYIFVELLPSEGDRAEAQTEIQNTIAALKAKPGVTGLTSSKFQSQHADVTREDLTSTIFNGYRQMSGGRVMPQALPDSAFSTPGFVTLLTPIDNGANTFFTIVKIDSIAGNDITKLKYSVIPAESAEQTQEFITEINGGKDFSAVFAEHAAQYGIPETQTTSLFGMEKGALRTALETAPVGVAFAFNDSVQGQPRNMVIKIVDRPEKENIYSVNIINYNLQPSQKTINSVKDDLRKYIANNGTAEAFAKNAEKAGYTAQTAVVSSSTANVAGIPETRWAVKWAMDGKKGTVSDVKENNRQTFIMAVALKDIYDDDYLGWEADKENLKAQVLKDKKAAKLVDQYKGKASNIPGYAEIMGVATANEDVVFGVNGMLNSANAKFQGAVANAKKGDIIGPMQTDNGVIVAEVKDVVTSEHPFNLNADKSEFIRVFTPMNNYMKLLLNGGKIENYSIDFYQAEK